MSPFLFNSVPESKISAHTGLCHAPATAANSGVRLNTGAGTPHCGSARSFQIRLNSRHHRHMVFTAHYILPAVFQPDIKTLITIGIITEILTYYNIAEIAPVSEKSPLPHNLIPPADG